MSSVTVSPITIVVAQKREPHPGKNSVSKLTKDSLGHVFNFLSLQDLSSCARVCQFWKLHAEHLLALAYQRIFFPSVSLTDHATLKVRCLARKALILQNLMLRRCAGSIKGLFKDRQDQSLHDQIRWYSKEYNSRYGSLFFHGDRFDEKGIGKQRIKRVCLNTGEAEQDIMIEDASLTHLPNVNKDGEISLLIARSNEVCLMKTKVETAETESATCTIPLGIGASLHTFATVVGERLLYQNNEHAYLFDLGTGKQIEKIENGFRFHGAISNKAGICRQKLFNLITEPFLCCFTLKYKLRVVDLKTKEQIRWPCQQGYIYTTQNDVIFYTYVARKIRVFNFEPTGCITSKPFSDICVNKGIDKEPLRIRRIENTPSLHPVAHGMASRGFVKMNHFFDLLAFTREGHTRIYDLATRKHLVTLQHAFDEFYFTAWHDGKFIAAGNRTGRTIQEMEVFDFGSTDSVGVQTTRRQRIWHTFLSCCCTGCCCG